MDGVAHFIEALGDEDGESASPCDEPDGGRGGGWIGQDGEDAGHD